MKNINCCFLHIYKFHISYFKNDLKSQCSALMYTNVYICTYNQCVCLFYSFSVYVHIMQLNESCTLNIIFIKIFTPSSHVHFNSVCCTCPRINITVMFTSRMRPSFDKLLLLILAAFGCISIRTILLY